jgi:hypothetical protein
MAVKHKPWNQGARWETTGWVWRGCEPPHPTTPKQYPWHRVQLCLNFNRAAVVAVAVAVADGAVSCDA